MKRTILHCDMNNFYASVECMLNPEIREYPVAVCGSVEDRHGIVLAKNYKAREFDVKTGDTVWQAKKKAKDIVIVNPHFDEYIKYSKLARKIYGRFTDLVEPYGMDECWLDITGTEKILGTPEEIADKIRQTIKYELGLTVSIGVSFNKIFSKLGSDMKKPDAVTVISENNFREKVWPLPASSLLGVGRSTKKILDSHCIFTIKDLAMADINWLQRNLGKNGLVLKNYANGIDHSPVTHIDYVFPAKSVGHGITTTEDLETPEQVWAVMLELTQNIGHQLRTHKKKAKGVSIQIKDNQLLVKQMQTPLEIPTQSAMIIAKTAYNLFKSNYMWQNNIRSVTVQAINLIPQDTPFQTDFFTNTKSTEKAEQLEECIEKIRAKFGKDSIKNGVLLQNLKIPKLKPEITMPSGLLTR